MRGRKGKRFLKTRFKQFFFILVGPRVGQVGTSCGFETDETEPAAVSNPGSGTGTDFLKILVSNPDPNFTTVPDPTFYYDTGFETGSDFFYGTGSDL